MLVLVTKVLAPGFWLDGFPQSIGPGFWLPFLPSFCDTYLTAPSILLLAGVGIAEQHPIATNRLEKSC